MMTPDEKTELSKSIAHEVYEKWEDKKKENDTMGAGVGLDQAGVLAVLADTARAGRGGGYFGGGEGGVCGSPYANISTIQHGLHYNRQSTEDHIDCVGDKVAAGLDSINNNFENAERTRQFTSVLMGQFQSELRSKADLAALAKEVADNARVSDKNLCDIQLKQSNDTAAILARMEAISKEGISRDLDRAERELIALRTQVACGCTTGCSTPCNS